ncbi:MAG: glycosyltransferase [Chitinivibrionales bacterium]|nr:glycosyltransferase [Chitinivibrionales bacterium]
MSRIAVIIPSWNRKHVIERSVTSVLNQSFDDYELVVVDDCSVDGTEELALFSDSRIRYERLDMHKGVSYARNYGVRCTSAPLLAFLDSDDEWHENKLEHHLDWIRRNPSFRISQTQEIWIRRGKRVNPPKNHKKQAGDIFEMSLKRCMITPSSVIMDRDLYHEFGGFNESFLACEDYDLWLKVTSKYPVGLIDEYLLTRYGGHRDQLSSTAFALDRFRIRSILHILYTGELRENQQVLAKRELVRKACIVAGGYKKRGDLKRYEQFRSIADVNGV